MRVLWFSPTPSLYTSKRWGHHGGGWISALQNIVQEVDNLELGVAFEYQEESEIQVIDDVSYYPIKVKKSIKLKLSGKDNSDILIAKSLQIIEDFKPDIIQLFGSEKWYGLLVNYTKVPIVIHMQGSLPSHYDARYPAGMSAWNKIMSSKTTFMQKLMAFRIDQTFKKNARREEQILKANHNFMGRTHWDKSIVQFFNPNANYFVCQEALRESFINSEAKWQYKDGAKLKLISVISGPVYKGVDVVLKTARLLKEHTNLDFEWTICGLSNIDFFEDTYNIKAETVHVKPLGIIPQEELKAHLLEASLYVHPSYIENSPNSVCEAQILGLPIIATNVGGLSTLIHDKETGFLVPANDTVKLAHIIKENWNNKKSLEKISQAGIERARQRHNPDKIKEDLMSIYNTILNTKQKSDDN